MSDVHILIDAIRMFFLVKIYKNAFRNTSPVSQRKMHVFLLLFLQAKYKFVGVTRQFNDCFMMLFCLFAILAWQNRHLVLSTILFAIAINIKMSALLIIPGFLLTVALKDRLAAALLSLISMLFLQVIFGLEFILVNPKAYF